MGVEAGRGVKQCGAGCNELPAAAFRESGLRRLRVFAGLGGERDRGEAVKRAAWAESFFFAGTSALLLLLANLLANWWFLSLFALTPFLYRISRARLDESIRLGLLLGFAFLSVSLSNNLLADPVPALLKLLCGTALFTVLSWFLCRVRASFGFNPVVMAVIWAGFELIVIELGFPRGLFGEAGFTNHYLNGVTVLFGFVIVSFTIVLLNSLIVIAVEKVVSLTEAREVASREGGRIWDLYFTPELFVEKWSLGPEVRGPPSATARAIP